MSAVRCGNLFLLDVTGQYRIIFLEFFFDSILTYPVIGRVGSSSGSTCLFLAGILSIPTYEIIIPHDKVKHKIVYATRACFSRMTFIVYVFLLVEVGFQYTALGLIHGKLFLAWKAVGAVSVRSFQDTLRRTRSP